MANKYMRCECTHQIEREFPVPRGRRWSPAAPSVSLSSTVWRSSRLLEKFRVSQKSPASMAVSRLRLWQGYCVRSHQETVPARSQAWEGNIRALMDQVSVECIYLHNDHRQRVDVGLVRRFSLHVFRPLLGEEKLRGAVPPRASVVGGRGVGRLHVLRDGAESKI